MDTVKMWLWILVIVVLFVISYGWLLVAHHRLGKPLPKSIKLSMIFAAIVMVIVVASAIAASLK